MKSFFCYAILIAFGLVCKPIFTIAQPDSTTIRVHFLHGSKPKRSFKHSEDKWFGGLLGGHAGVEYAPNCILNFVPKARFHFFSKRHIINSRFVVHDTLSFYEILSGKPDSVKKTIVSIRISASQKLKIDSIASCYRKQSPYDYAFFGMRCGAAAYDVLAQVQVLPTYSFSKTWCAIFYPRRLRRKLESNQLVKITTITKVNGSYKRKWEND
jgi:hypothetical protein